MAVEEVRGGGDGRTSHCREFDCLFGLFSLTRTREPSGQQDFSWETPRVLDVFNTFSWNWRGLHSEPMRFYLQNGWFENTNRQISVKQKRRKEKRVSWRFCLTNTLEHQLALRCTLATPTSLTATTQCDEFSWDAQTTDGSWVPPDWGEQTRTSSRSLRNMWLHI